MNYANLKSGRIVLIVGASPDRINHNSVMRQYVKRGFAEILGREFVFECSLENSIEMASILHPALVLCFGSCMPDQVNYGPLRALCSQMGAEMIFWMHDDPYEFDYSFRVTEVADRIFSNDRWASLHYDHPNVHFMPMAACQMAHYRPWSSKKELDISFCGVGFPNRARIIRNLSPILKRHRTQIFGCGWEPEISFASNMRLKNTELSDLYAQSWIALYMGRDLHLANDKYKLDPSTPGPRIFEAAMGGVVQLCFIDGLEIADYYTIDQEVLVFDDPRGFSMQVEKMLDMPHRAKEIALAAQSRTLREHTYSARARQILNICGWTLAS
jgi:spore maturation protein CgeB